MRLRGRFFDGSDSLFTTQQNLVKRAGQAMWLTEFTPVRLDHLGFVNRLLQTFCVLDICCALVNAYPAYIAGVLSVFSTGVTRLSLLYNARVDSPILDNIYKVPSFQIGPFTFVLTDSERFDDFNDYSIYAITQGKETVQFLIGVVDTATITYGSKSSINLLEFLWDNTLIFVFLKCGIVCVPFDSPKVLYLRHNGVTSRGWMQNTLCRPCFGNYMPVINSFIPMCTNSNSCSCHVCLRQPPSLRSLASFTVFHISNNLSEFTLSSETVYQHNVRAVKSKIVPADRLIPDSFPHLCCTFARVPATPSVKRYHKDCVDPSQFPWYTHAGEYCSSKDKIIARLCTDKYEWWCGLCDKSLLATADCLFC